MTIRDLFPSTWGRRDYPERSDASFGDLDSPQSAMLQRFVPSIDVHDRESVIEITAEVPGMDESDIHVSITNNVLTISGEKRCQKEERDRGRHSFERSYGSFSRSMRLPEGLDVNKADATYKNGVLSITLPKTLDYIERAKKIPISSTGPDEEPLRPS